MIRFEILGDKAVREAMQQVAPTVQGHVERSIGRLCLKLMSTVKSPKLSGGVLKVQTGRLRRSINMRMTGAGSSLVEGFVGTNVEYGRAHELGFKGTVTVKEHLRRTKTVKLNYLRGKKAGQFNKSRTERVQEAKAATITVKSHTRQMDIPERSFLRATLKEMAPDIQAALQAAVKQGIKRR